MLRTRSTADSATASPSLRQEIRQLSRPLQSPQDLEPLLEAIGDTRYVLLGEASHGTHEYYTWRSAISRRLIIEKGFSMIAVEGDWPDCERVNQYVRGRPTSHLSATEVLRDFSRWPTWMWANQEIAQLAEWLREHNRDQAPDRQVSFHGLDVYSLWDSLSRVFDYLRGHHQDAEAAARKALRCFEPYGEDVQEYAHATRWFDESCEDEVVDLLKKVRQIPWPPPDVGGESRFDAEQNALVAQHAEEYYRAMVRGGPDSWNLRDEHMVETLERLMAHRGPRSKVILWEHNTHIGDARFTDMREAGMRNVGEMIRRRHAAEGTFLVGFAGYQGSVIAGRSWDAPMESMPVPPGRPGSWEEVLHRSTDQDALLIFNQEKISDEFQTQRGHRAIGVIYHPEAERGNYVPTILPKRYDALLFLHETNALHPLHDLASNDRGEPPETYPSGM